MTYFFLRGNLQQDREYIRNPEKTVWSFSQGRDENLSTTGRRQHRPVSTSLKRSVWSMSNNRKPQYCGHWPHWGFQVVDLRQTFSSCPFPGLTYLTQGTRLCIYILLCSWFLVLSSKPNWKITYVYKGQFIRVIWYACLPMWGFPQK